MADLVFPRCPTCQMYVAFGTFICRICGTYQEPHDIPPEYPYPRCVECQSLLAYETKICPVCGGEIPAHPVPPQPPRLDELYFGGRAASLDPPLVYPSALTLAGMRELPFDDLGRAPVIRLLVSPSFSGATAVRAMLDADPQLVAVARGTRNERSLSESERAVLQQRIVACRLEQMPYAAPQDIRPNVGWLDGTTWLVEYFDGGHHSLVDRWGIEHQTVERGLVAFRSLCMYMLELAGLSNDPNC